MDLKEKVPVEGARGLLLNTFVQKKPFGFRTMAEDHPGISPPEKAVKAEDKPFDGNGKYMCVTPLTAAVSYHFIAFTDRNFAILFHPEAKLILVHFLDGVKS